MVKKKAGKISKKKKITKTTKRKKATKKVHKKISKKKGKAVKKELQTTVAIAQINSSVGDLDANAQKIIATIQQAKNKGAELVVFPELTITGYPPKDLLLRQDFIDTNLRKFIDVVNVCRGITCIFGFVNCINGAVHNAVAVVQDQKIITIDNKAKLPSHPYFDENKYFIEGKRADIFFLKDKRVGVVICPNAFDEQAHIEAVVEKGVDIIIIIGASHYAVRKPQEREQLCTHLVKKFEVPLLYCNNVGAEGALVFDGSSFFVNVKGNIAMRGRKFTEELIMINIDGAATLANPSVNQAEEVYQALTLGIRDYFAKTGFSKAIIGVSGGIDSAVSLCIAVHALGAENVKGILLPSKITSKEALIDAKKLCETLGVHYQKINIDLLVGTVAKIFGLKYEKKNISATEQNIQARVRGQILMNIANKEGALTISSVNKSSLAVGYCILDGDMAGTLAPLADVWKTQVYSLAQFINTVYKKKHKKLMIPQRVLERPASQELRAGQVDTQDIPPYETMDKILQFYIAHKKEISEIAHLGFDIDLVRQIVHMFNKSQYKRELFPTGITISSCPLWDVVLPAVSGWRG